MFLAAVSAAELHGLTVTDEAWDRDALCERCGELLLQHAAAAAELSTRSLQTDGCRVADGFAFTANICATVASYSNTLLSVLSQQSVRLWKNGVELWHHLRRVLRGPETDVRKIFCHFLHVISGLLSDYRA